MQKRRAGVLAPIFALPSGYSSGAFGREAYEFVDRLAEGGFAYWQVLPFTVTDAFRSPYASPSSFSVNPYFIDLVSLAERELITKEELEAAKESIPYTCEYERLEAERMALLSRAASRFTDDGALTAFLDENPYLEEYCRFAALKKANGGVPWQAFRVQEPDADAYRTHAFIAYEFFRQWSALHAYANARGIRVIGDLPIYVSHDSADVFFHSELFCLDENGDPTGVAGVPPDYFCEDGQMWGNPLYRWEKMREDDFSFWRARIRQMLTFFDGVRLDHFRGYDTYFDIPYGAPNAKSGVWREGPREAFVDMLKEEGEGALLIAEDLGDLSPSVEELLAYSELPGMRVFAFATDGADSHHIPHAYPANTVAYSGTHDNNTLLGFLFSLDGEKRRELFDYCRYGGDDVTEGCRAVIETLYLSHANLVILPIQDLLFFGEDTRFNTPGRAEGNWAFRITDEQMRSIDMAYFRTLAERYGRI